MCAKAAGEFVDGFEAIWMAAGGFMGNQNIRMLSNKLKIVVRKDRAAMF